MGRLLSSRAVSPRRVLLLPKALLLQLRTFAYHEDTHYSRHMKKPRICAVVAIGKNRELGKDGKLLRHIPDDLKRFKELTMGHPVIMGRKTFELTLAYTQAKPLPGRTNIVVTRDADWKYEGVIVV